MGEASSVAVNSKGHVFVYSRGNSTGPAYGATASQLLEFAPDGKYIREIGHNIYAWSYAHAVRVDSHDNVWVGGQRLGHGGPLQSRSRVTLVLGRKTEASDENSHPWEHPIRPCRRLTACSARSPTLTWDPQGNIYVSDGISTRASRNSTRTATG